MQLKLTSCRKRIIKLQHLNGHHMVSQGVATLSTLRISPQKTNSSSSLRVEN